MADGSFPGLISRNRDVNTTSNTLYTSITDDAGNLVGVTGNALDVNAANASVHVDDSAFAIASDSVVASGYLADETATDSVDEGDIGLARMTLDRRVITSSEQSGTWDIGTVTTLTTITNDVSIDDGGNVISIDDAGGSLTVDASQLDIDDLNLTDDAVQISGNGTVNSETNPIFVQSVDTAVSASEIHDYDTASAVASDATDNHDYTVTGTTFLLKSVIVSGSGNIKFEIQSGPVAGLATVAVGFLTGRQGDTKQINFDPALEVPVTSTGTVRVIRTNRQGAATDLYSTIIGNDV